MCKGLPRFSFGHFTLMKIWWNSVRRIGRRTAFRPLTRQAALDQFFSQIMAGLLQQTIRLSAAIKDGEEKPDCAQSK